MMFGRFAMMTRGMFMMFGCLVMMLRCFLRHSVLPFYL
jgi:hypothetical protein